MICLASLLQPFIQHHLIHPPVLRSDLIDEAIQLGEIHRGCQ